MCCAHWCSCSAWDTPAPRGVRVRGRLSISFCSNSRNRVWRLRRRRRQAKLLFRRVWRHFGSLKSHPESTEFHREEPRRCDVFLCGSSLCSPGVLCGLLFYTSFSKFSELSVRATPAINHRPPIHWSTQSFTVLYQSWEFCGLRTQWPSSG